MFLLSYLLSRVPDPIIVVVKYGSNEHIHPVPLSGIFLHQCSLEVTPYSWEREVGESGKGCETQGYDMIQGRWEEHISESINTDFKIITYKEQDSSHPVLEESSEHLLTYS